jgi:hypothetical protein
VPQAAVCHPFDIEEAAVTPRRLSANRVEDGGRACHCHMLIRSYLHSFSAAAPERGLAHSISPR